MTRHNLLPGVLQTYLGAWQVPEPHPHFEPHQKTAILVDKELRSK